jgi:excisionase family DNA binding protein
MCLGAFIAFITDVATKEQLRKEVSVATAPAIRIPAPPKEAEKQQAAKLYRMLIHDGTAYLVGPDNLKIELPPSIYDILVKVVENMQEGKAIALVPLLEELSTQAAADLLGVSRQFFVRELEAGKLPFHRAGSHRRIYLKDVLDYKKQRETSRAESIDRMAQISEEAGIYDKFIPFKE